VDRFGNTKPSTAAESSKIGPGTYTVSNLINHHKKSTNTVYSGFNCTEQRFADNTYKETTPGPGSYQQQAQAQNQTQKVAKNCVFGTTSKRFTERQ